METISSSFGPKFVASSEPSNHTKPQYENNQPIQASNLELPGTSYISVGPLKIFVRFYEQEYINRVAQVIYEVDNSETWYICDDGDWIEIDPEQLWFWTTEWQAGEKEVDDEYKQGLAKHFDTIDDMIESLLE